jgi:colicin import membrane protein
VTPLNRTHAGSTPYDVPPEPRRWRALMLATVVHAGLFLFLWVGVRWQNEVPVAVEAEVWDMQTRAAAPPPEPSEPSEPAEPEPPAPSPAPAPAPAPIEQPPPKPAAPPVDQPPAVKPPDIALERRKEKLKLDKQKLAEAARLKAIEQKQEALDQAAAQAREKAKEQAKEQANARNKQEIADKKLADKQAKDSKAKEQEDAQHKKDLADKKLADQRLADKKLSDKKLADKLAKAKGDAEEQKAISKARDAEMRRITGGGGSGDAPKSTATRVDSGYVAAITRKIKGNIAYNGSTDVPGNPRAVFKISQLPNGEIISKTMTKKSGIAAFDNAVENAIAKSSPLPKKKDGTVERDLEVIFDLKDLP